MNISINFLENIFSLATSLISIKMISYTNIWKFITFFWSTFDFYNKEVFCITFSDGEEASHHQGDDRMQFHYWLQVIGKYRQKNWFRCFQKNIVSNYEQIWRLLIEIWMLLIICFFYTLTAGSVTYVPTVSHT